MSDQSNLCTRCKVDNTRDSYFCAKCAAILHPEVESPEFDKYMKAVLSGPDNESDEDTISRLNKLFELDDPLPRGDEDGERFVPMANFQIHAMRERMATSPEPSF